MARLDASLQAMTGYRLRRTTSKAMSRLNAVFSTFGLRRSTYATLAIVVENPGQRQGKVAEALAIDRPNFVQLVDELEAAGLLSREKATDDKRAYALTATPKGKKLFQAAALAAQTFEANLTRGLSRPEIDALHAALELISTNLNCQETTDGQ